jgi:hypothetical protein
MRLRKLYAAAFLSAALIVVPQTGQQAVAGKTKDAIAAGLIGAAIVAAASRHHKHHQKFYYDGYQPYQPNGYDTYWNNAYSPAFGITCYRAQVACYKTNGHFSAKWTRIQFADGE